MSSLCEKIGIVALLSMLAIAAVPPLAAQTTCSGSSEPYVFILFDTSGSMNWSPPCSAAQFANGDCDWICPSGDCFVPLQTDDPASKLYQAKEALYEVVADADSTLFGFATFNQDDLRVRDKHWLYTASVLQPDGNPGNFVTLLSGTPFPGSGAEEVFGATWPCDEGSGDKEKGCWGSPSKVADLDDPWELGRTQRLPKLGRDMNEETIIYVRDPNDDQRYKVVYRPVTLLPSGLANAYGNASFAADIELRLCTNTSSNCSSTLIERQIVYYDLVSDFLSWDNGARRTAPADGFFNQSNAGDANALNTCAGWDGNDDTVDDLYQGYDLRFPTFPNPPPLRFDLDGDGTAETEDFTFGDVVPLDWEDDHQQDVLVRLAPNASTYPLAPDFRVATYLSDARQPGESFLRLENEAERPIMADGSTPIGNALRDFRDYYGGSFSSPGFIDIAEALDPEIDCRQKILIVLSDGENTCSGPSPCSEAAALYEQYGVLVYAVGFGISSPGSSLTCIAENGGTGDPLFPQTRQELVDALSSILDLD